MKSILIPIMAFACLSTSFAQTAKIIKGSVFYEETRDPIPFAYVKLKGIAYGTVTDYDGSFTIKIPARYQNEVLIFSYLGYKTAEFPLADYTEPLKVYLQSEPTELFTVIVTAKKEKNPKSILKKALRSIPDNYVDQPFTQEGYYREYVKENDRPVKYADASFQLDLAGYSGKMEKRKAYENPSSLSGVTSVGSWTSWSSSLHRWHFHQRVLKGEASKNH